jgi:intracellular multiplication protein IcmO
MTQQAFETHAEFHLPEIDHHGVSARVTRDSLFVGFNFNSNAPTYLPHDQVGSAGLIFGAESAGWSDLDRLFIYQQIQRGGGLVLFDTTGRQDRLREVFRFCSQNNRTDDILIFNPADPAASNTYNVVLRGEPSKVAARVLTLVPSTASNPGADFYRQEANYGLTTVIDALQTAGLAYNTKDLAIVLQSHDVMRELEAMLKSTNPDHDATRNLSLLADAGNGLREKQVYGGIAGRLFMFGTGKFGQVMNSYTPDIDLFSAVRSNKIVYVSIPKLGADQAALAIASMFSADLLDATAAVHAADFADPTYLPTLVVPGGWQDVVHPAGTPAQVREVIRHTLVPHLNIDPPEKIVPQRFDHPKVIGADFESRLEGALGRTRT